MTFSHSAKPDARLKAVDRLVAELNADSRPIACGPWRSEVGFEAMYWLPFLRCLASKVKGFDKRAVVVTRGGLAPLYADVAHAGHDLYALRDVADVRRENLYDHKFRHEAKTIKQLQMTEWDEQVLADAARELGLGTLYHVVHPAWMYWALAPYWEEHAGLKYLTSLAHYARLPKIAIDADMPQDYVAMKWYARPTLPYPNADVAEFVQHVVAVVAKQVPVILLNAGGEHDDHIDIPIVGDNVHALPPELKPEENLKVQAAVIANAKCFVGTYGGMAQLALRLGVPSISFWTEFGQTAHGHLSLSSWLSKQTGTPFCAGSLNDGVLWQQVMAGKTGFGKALPVAA